MMKEGSNYNAIRIDVLGNIQPVWIADFSDEECLGQAVDVECYRVDRVLTEQLEQISGELGFSIMGYVDAMGYTKNYVPNTYMQEFTGYHLLPGPGVLCGCNKYEYGPLEPEQLEQLLGYLAEKLFYAAAQRGDARACAWLGCFYGMEEYGCKNIQKAAYWLQEASYAGDALGWLFLGILIGWDEYYPFQPAHIRYCLEKSMELSQEETFEELLDYFAEKDIESIRNAKPLKPEYPYIDGDIVLESKEDATELYAKALDLLEKEESLEDGMKLMLEAADLGHSDACHYAGCKLYDYGQGEEFQFDEEGVLETFPADGERAWKYLVHTGLMGNTEILQILPYMGVKEEHARKFLELYVGLTGDKTIPKYILPNLKKVLELDKDGSQVCDACILPLEKDLYYIVREEDSLAEKIENLQQAFRDATHREYGESMAWRLSVDGRDSMAMDWSRKLQDRDKIESLLDIYLYIQSLENK